MNNGTIIRTILAVATCLNTALLATDVAQFHNGTVDLIYRIASVVLNFVIVACGVWFNNDFTVEMDTATKLGREAKAKRDYVPETVEEPEDSYIVESEVEHGNE